MAQSYLLQRSQHIIQTLDFGDFIAAQIQICDVREDVQFGDVFDLVGGEVQLVEVLEHWNLDAVDVGEVLAVHDSQGGDIAILILQEALTLNEV